MEPAYRIESMLNRVSGFVPASNHTFQGRKSRTNSVQRRFKHSLECWRVASVEQYAAPARSHLYEFDIGLVMECKHLILASDFWLLDDQAGNLFAHQLFFKGIHPVVAQRMVCAKSVACECFAKEHRCPAHAFVIAVAADKCNPK